MAILPAPIGSKDYLRDFYGRLEAGEGCAIPAGPCVPIAKAAAQVERIDLRTTKGRQQVLLTLDQVAKIADCKLCDAAQGAQVDLIRPWSHNKNFQTFRY